jgi:hypothetical protein
MLFFWRFLEDLSMNGQVGACGAMLPIFWRNEMVQRWIMIDQPAEMVKWSPSEFKVDKGDVYVKWTDYVYLEKILDTLVKTKQLSDTGTVLAIYRDIIKRYEEFISS